MILFELLLLKRNTALEWHRKILKKLQNVVKLNRQNHHFWTWYVNDVLYKKCRPQVEILKQYIA